VLDRCAELWQETGGYFDINAGGTLDPSGYVKGWAVQRACDRLRAEGAANHCLNAGGDIFVSGSPGPRKNWRVGIRHPWEPLAVAWVLEVTDTAVATSGTYERGLHVIDPYTGKPASALRSVTVVATSAPWSPRTAAHCAPTAYQSNSAPRTSPPDSSARPV